MIHGKQNFSFKFSAFNEFMRLDIGFLYGFHSVIFSRQLSCLRVSFQMSNKENFREGSASYQLTYSPIVTIDFVLKLQEAQICIESVLILVPFKVVYQLHSIELIIFLLFFIIRLNILFLAVVCEIHCLKFLILAFFVL